MTVGLKTSTHRATRVWTSYVSCQRRVETVINLLIYDSAISAVVRRELYAGCDRRRGRSYRDN